MLVVLSLQPSIPVVLTDAPRIREAWLLLSSMSHATFRMAASQFMVWVDAASDTSSGFAAAITAAPSVPAGTQQLPKKRHFLMILL